MALEAGGCTRLAGPAQYQECSFTSGTGRVPLGNASEFTRMRKRISFVVSSVRRRLESLDGIDMTSLLYEGTGAT